MYVNFGQMERIDCVVNGLVPGYYRRAIDPYEALENQQGNCFTNAVIGALALSHCFAVEASMAWSPRLHATPRGDMFLASKSGHDISDKNIAHIELLAPRGVDEYDVLSIGWGQKVTDGNAKNGDVFVRHDRGGVINNYNFPTKAPRDENVEGLYLQEDPLVKIVADGEIIPTDYGVEVGLESMDWRDAANAYLDVLDLAPINFEVLEQMFNDKYLAWCDWCTENAQ